MAYQLLTRKLLYDRECFSPAKSEIFIWWEYGALLSVAGAKMGSNYSGLNLENGLIIIASLVQEFEWASRRTTRLLICIVIQCSNSTCRENYNIEDKIFLSSLFHRTKYIK